MTSNVESRAVVKAVNADDSGVDLHLRSNDEHMNTVISTPTSSQQSESPKRHVANGKFATDKHTESATKRIHKPPAKWRAVVTLVVLCLVNALNYMDRFTLPAVLDQLIAEFSIDYATTGLLQTVFVCSYMIVSPIFGYLGDHHNRIYIIAGGVAFWSCITLASSFVPSDMFAVFALTRALVGVGEASYVTVAPSLIGDLFAGERRSTAIAFFALTTPIGSGLGYVVGGYVAQASGSWRWALRVTPPLGVICVILTIILVREPERGAADRIAEQKQHLAERQNADSSNCAKTDADSPMDADSPHDAESPRHADVESNGVESDALLRSNSNEVELHSGVTDSGAELKLTESIKNGMIVETHDECRPMNGDVSCASKANKQGRLRVWLADIVYLLRMYVGVH